MLYLEGYLWTKNTHFNKKRAVLSGGNIYEVHRGKAGNYWWCRSTLQILDTRQSLIPQREPLKCAKTWNLLYCIPIPKISMLTQLVGNIRLHGLALQCMYSMSMPWNQKEAHLILLRESLWMVFDLLFSVRTKIRWHDCRTCARPAFEVQRRMNFTVIATNWRRWTYRHTHHS